VIRGSVEYEGVTPSEVEDEAHRHVGSKFHELAGARLRDLLGELTWIRIDPSGASTPSDLPASVAVKDHHVIAACLAAAASICLTLDRRHLLSKDVRQWGSQHGIRFLIPGEFLAWDRLREERGI